MLIVVDPGKHTTKAITPNFNTFHFRTKMSDNTQEINVQGNSFDIVFEGHRYVIGEQAEEQSYDISKTNLLHKTATYVAVSKLIPNNSEIKLVINCPVSIYKYKPKREEYLSYIRNNGAFSIVVSGKKHHYDVADALVLPEDYGAVYRHPSFFKGKRVALVGLGGLNMNFMIVNNLVPEISTMFTVDHGGNGLEASIINELNSLLAVNISHKEAPYILKNRGIKIKGKIEPRSTQVVDDIIADFVDTVIQEIKRNGHTPDTLDVVFVGGTSELVQEQIRSAIVHATIVREAQWASVEGSLRLGEIRYAKT